MLFGSVNSLIWIDWKCFCSGSVFFVTTVRCSFFLWWSEPKWNFKCGKSNHIICSGKYNTTLDSPWNSTCLQRWFILLKTTLKSLIISHTNLNMISFYYKYTSDHIMFFFYSKQTKQTQTYRSHVVCRYDSGQS